MFSMRVSSFAAVILGIASLAGCAGSEEGSAPPADESYLTNGSSSGSVPVDGIATCEGRKSCVNAFVMKTLLASPLELTEMFQGETPIKNAGEYVIDWMQAGSETYSTIGIETTPLGSGKYTAKIGLGNHDIEGGTESGCSFSFTIDHDKVVESQVQGWCAG